MILFHGTEQIGVLFQKIKNAPERGAFFVCHYASVFS